MNKIFSRLIWAALAAFCLRACIYEPIRATDDSMAPVIKKDEVFLVSKLTYGLRVPGSGTLLYRWREPAKGDLVVAVGLGDPPVSVLRKVVNVPGEKFKAPDGQEASLKPGEFYLEALQKESTQDSRQFGPVPQRAILGKATYIWLPNEQNASEPSGRSVESKKFVLLRPIL